jgi:acyl homoserine lactone synthase
MITIVSAEDFSVFGEEIAAMHRLRYRVFYERLGWDVMASGGMEVDEYDVQSPLYILNTFEDGQLGGCVRLLPTTGPYMLRDTFPTLAGDQPMPCTPTVWEASRFAVESPRRAGSKALSPVTAELFAAMVELGLIRGLNRIAAVVDVRMERILRMAGWPLQRFAPPQAVGITLAVGGLLEVSPAALDRIRERGGLAGPVLAGLDARVAA